MIITRFDEAIPFDAATALTVGTFDGVHCGHRGIIDRMKATASAEHERTVVVTFDPHPQIVLAKPDREPVRLLTSIDERCALLADLGVDMTVVIPFTREFASTPPDVFIRDHIAGRIGVRHFFIGHDHMFGKDRGGNEELLQRLGDELGFVLERVEPLYCNGQIVSSTKVRQALQAGDVTSAAEMLGRPYTVTGTVVRGDGRGAKLGIPTANIETLDPYKLLPGNGVYLVSSEIDGRTVHGMANIGRRPTFTDGSQTTLEVHYLDLDTMLYDRTLTVAFRHFIRAEQKFPSLDMFLSQIREDRSTAYELLSNG